MRSGAVVGWVAGTALVMMTILSVAGCEDDFPAQSLQFDANFGFDAAPPFKSPPGLGKDAALPPGFDAAALPPGFDAAAFIPDAAGFDAAAFIPDASIPDANTAKDASTADASIPPACNDGKKDPGETCDPLASCPSACPAVVCQKRELKNAGTCQAACVNTTMETACVNGDGCCPSGCNANNDNDCVAACDNGKIEGSEKCDPLASCPTTCAPIGCQLRKVQNAGTCAAECVNDTLKTACVNGDGCCPAECNTLNDSDCLIPACGNNVVEAGEICDPLTSCPQACPMVACQEYKVANAGTCQAACVEDKLRTACTNGDGCCPVGGGCNATNDSDCAAVCHNGIFEPPGELCDDGTCPTSCPPSVADACQKYTLTKAGTCQAQCTANPRETACINADGCCPSGCNANTDSDCAPICGNGITEAPDEKCDGIDCPTTCPANPDNACEKYTLVSKDTCMAACTGPVAETLCIHNDGCCPAGGGCTNLTDNDCGAVCGNGVVETGETCDGTGRQACPTCAAKPYAGYCYGTGSANTCNVNCTAPVLTCGPSGDDCCPYGGNGACGSGADTDCTGSSWQPLLLTWVDFSQGCQVVTIGGIVGNGSYDVTTCAPGKPSSGYGDPSITDVSDTAIGAAAPYVYPVANDNCTDPNALPKLAGWYCKNKGGDNLAACAAPSPGGFKAIASPAGLAVTICGGGGAVTPVPPDCPLATKECWFPPSSYMPVYIWFNAPSAPTFISTYPVPVIQ